MPREISPCKQCGCIYTYVNAQARGPVQVRYNEAGRECEVYYDELYFDRSHVVRCEDCGKIRRDLEVSEHNRVREIIT